MKKFILVIALICGYESIVAQTNKKLLGACNRDSLLQAPWKEWFEPNYAAYSADNELIAKLKKSLTKEFSFEIFFGTWCGDSKREVPRFYKIADAIGIPEQKIKLIGVDSGEAYKQGPNAETYGKAIYRVATFIVLKSNVEVGRLIEHPVTTLEEDLYKIITGLDYQPNYKSYSSIEQWLQKGLLTNPNTSLRGLAKQLKPLLVSPSELNSCAQVLAVQGKIKEAIFVCRMNAYVFYDNAETYALLARTLSNDGQHKEALENIEYAIRINTADEELSYFLNSFFAIKKAAEGI
jgi:tetratricopeptide (TPR) repeat protein